MPNSLQDKYWELLIDRIYRKDPPTCTPFLGAGACYGLLPLAGDVARKWAATYNYPFPDSSDLVKLAQYVAINYDRMAPKEEILNVLKQEAKAPDFKDPLQPHRALADMPLPIYLTTNYDNLMVDALKYRHRDAKRELCRWNRLVQNQPSLLDEKTGFKPTAANPVVFHFHGHNEVPESLVLTEDDYMDFLVNLSTRPGLIPPVIEDALSKTMLLFIGYKIVDWSFRVLMRSISRFTEGSLVRTHVAVMLPPRGGDVLQPEAVDSSPQKAQEYLDKYYENLNIRVYWGTVREFVAELNKRKKSMAVGD